jgi:WD40 repeat protein
VLVSAVAFAPDGQTLASSAGNVFDAHFPGEVALWDPGSARRRAAAAVPGGAWSLAFAPDGRALAVGSGAHAVNLWDLSWPGAAAPVIFNL